MGDALQLGVVIGHALTAVVGVVVWRARLEGAERDEAIDAILGIPAIAVLGLGLVRALVEVPGDLATRLAAEAALSVIGGGLLVASLWARLHP